MPRVITAVQFDIRRIQLERQWEQIVVNVLTDEKLLGVAFVAV